MVSTNDELQQTASADVQVDQFETKTISEEDFTKAQKNFQQGKKNLVLNKYAESVNNIEEACRVYSAKFGEFDPQCAEVYFYFGKALLELARVENNVLGNALAGVPEDTGPIDDSRYGNPDEIAPEEKEQISDKVIDAMCEPETKPTEEATTTTTENGTTTKPEETTATSMATGEETTKTDEKMATTETTTTTTTPENEPMNVEEKKPTTEGEGAASSSKKEDEADGEEDEEDDDEDEEETAEDGEGKESADEISNLQRAWEMFELAKLVYTKHYEEEPLVKKKRVAECLLKLGEIGIEQELYEQACGDIKECIRLQEEQRDDERDERFLAESYYQLGLAQQFGNLFEEARESFQRALNILQLRTDKLKGRLQTAPQLDDDEKTKLNEEIAEIESLLPDLNGKLEELNEQDKQAMAAIQEAKECFINSVNGGTLNPSAVNAEEVKDITSMVKSKRKISNGTSDDVGAGAGLKKTRLSTEQQQNGTTTTTTDETPMQTTTAAPENGTATETVGENASTTTTTTTTETTVETVENGVNVEN